MKRTQKLFNINTKKRNSIFECDIYDNKEKEGNYDVQKHHIVDRIEEVHCQDSVTEDNIN